MDQSDETLETSDERIAELKAEVERLERELARSSELRREAAASDRSRATELKRVERRYEALRGRRSVRLVLAISARSRRFVDTGQTLAAAPRRAVRSIRRRIRDRFRQRSLRASAKDERDLAAAIRQDLASPGVDHGPLVSIVILNRDGRAHLERCLRALATTVYRDVEIVVVDNGSTDGSPDLAEGFAMPFPVKVVRNLENRSFSEANGQGVASAAGELICFLNNDVDPITEHWLGYLVETLTATGAAAVGARLIYPRHRGGTRAGKRFADLTLQHAGVAFDRAEAIPVPRAIGAGGDPRGPAAEAVEERPALTAACLLVRRGAFEAVGGFAADYDYGLEDVDLCLRLRDAGGRLFYDGRAALWHHESATRAADPELRRSRVARNREAYLDAWGPRIFRDAMLDALDGGDRFSDAPFHVAILGVREADPPDADERGVRELRDALDAFGWRVSRRVPADGRSIPDPSVEAVIVVDDAVDLWKLPRRLVSLAWIRSEPERWVERPWFDDYDIVLASDPDIVAIVRERSAKIVTAFPIESGAGSVHDAIAFWATATRYGLRVGVPSREVVDYWGDYHFARALQRSLERAGHPTRLHLLPDWSEPVAAREDVTVHLLGFKEAPTRHSQVNLLWHISHPDLATPELYERYEHVFVASDRFAARMAARTRVPVTPLHQATDPEWFRPDPTGPAHDLLFVGNSRNVRRRIVDDVVATGHDIAIYGGGWRPDLVDPRFVKGDGIPNAKLRGFYSSASIVLNDHWNDMLAEGFISNRLYDALACGSFVISDHISELETEFDDAVVTYSDRAELGLLIDRYLADPDERRRRGARGRAAVIARHTFDERARVLRESVAPLLPIARAR